MNRYGTGDNLFQPSTGKRRLVITAQLFKAAASMNHIDELFQWLADVIAQQFDVQVIQFWALQNSRNNQVSVQLRAMNHLVIPLPQDIVVNDQVAAWARRIIAERSNPGVQKLSDLFSAYYASILTRFDLNYCAYYFLGGNVLLPPAYTTSSHQEIASPLAVSVLLFLPYLPLQDTLTTINLILEQAIVPAKNRGLLLPAAQLMQGQQELTLGDVVPHRIEDAGLMTSNNPFTSSVAISDKQARRIYSAIDGHKNVDEICRVLFMDLKGAYQALHILLTQHRIELYGPGGEVVDISVFFEKL